MVFSIDRIWKKSVHYKILNFQNEKYYSLFKVFKCLRPGVQILPKQKKNFGLRIIIMKYSKSKLQIINIIWYIVNALTIKNVIDWNIAVLMLPIVYL